MFNTGPGPGGKVRVQDYVIEFYEKNGYGAVFHKLEPMKELNIEIGSCNWITSNLKAIDIMANITSELIDYYDDLLFTAKNELKANETLYANTNSTLDTQINKYQTKVDDYREGRKNDVGDYNQQLIE